MVKRNSHIAKLHSHYLFPEISRRKNTFLKDHPEAKLISLGIGDTTEPLPTFIADALGETAYGLSTPQGYTGYGPEEGYKELRQQITEQLYQNKFATDEVFISDGTNSDIGRLQILFGNRATIAVQDPSYPVYVDTGVILGHTADYNLSSRGYEGISYMPCTASNDFFPDLSQAKRTDLIYFCSPNNPTGAVATYQQLKDLVAFAERNHSIIIYDTAYGHYIQNSEIPRSIYAIPGAEKVAIELGSFSKMAGFTGVRLAWSIVPKALRFEDGHSVNSDWNRVHSTFFNGASNIAQKGGMAVLHAKGQEAIQTLIHYYMENTRILRSTLLDLNYTVYGGLHAPYIWVHFPNKTSWEAFDFLLEKSHLISAPGSGFGPSGEGFIRLSAFGKRANIEEAAGRLRKALLHQ